MKTIITTVGTSIFTNYKKDDLNNEDCIDGLFEELEEKIQSKFENKDNNKDYYSEQEKELIEDSKKELYCKLSENWINKENPDASAENEEPRPKGRGI